MKPHHQSVSLECVITYVSLGASAVRQTHQGEREKSELSEDRARLPSAARCDNPDVGTVHYAYERAKLQYEKDVIVMRNFPVG